MNNESKLLTVEQRKTTVLPILKAELARLPDYDGFGNSNDGAKRDLKIWIKELESGVIKDEEVKYFLSNENKWIHSCLCDYLP